MTYSDVFLPMISATAHRFYLSFLAARLRATFFAMETELYQRIHESAEMPTSWICRVLHQRGDSFPSEIQAWATRQILAASPPTWGGLEKWMPVVVTPDQTILPLMTLEARDALLNLFPNSRTMTRQ